MKHRPVARLALALFGLLGSGAGLAQLTGNPPPAEVNPWRVVLGTLLVALLAAAVLVLRRPGRGGALLRPRGGADAVRVVSRANLDARNVVAVVETQGRRWLVGAGPQGPTLLAELAADPVPQPTAKPAGDAA